LNITKDFGSLLMTHDSLLVSLFLPVLKKTFFQRNLTTIIIVFTTVAIVALAAFI